MNGVDLNGDNNAAEAEAVRYTAICYTKLRDQLGMTGISVDPATSKAYVRLARHWERATAKMPTLAQTVSDMYAYAQWDMTYIEQETGEHIIDSLISGHGVPVETINTSKQVKEGDDISGIRIMDRVEMTEYLSYLLLTHAVQFPPAHTSTHIDSLEAQMPFWSRHTTEAGSVDYYAPGEEPDDLVRSLMVCCFAARNHLGHGGSEGRTALASPLEGNPFSMNSRMYDIEWVIEREMAAAFPSYRPDYY